MLLGFALPESPVFLLSKGKMAEAEASLAQIAKFNGIPLQFNPKDFADWDKQELGTSIMDSPGSIISHRNSRLSQGSTSPRVVPRS